MCCHQNKPPRSLQGLGGGKMRDPGNEIVVIIADSCSSNSLLLRERLFIVSVDMVVKVSIFP